MVAAAADNALRPPISLEELDAAVDSAIDAGESGSLRVLGYGEVTLVLGWPPQAPRHAVKRLPAFADERELDSYRVLLHEYLEALAGRGIDAVPTELVTRRSPEGELHAYLVQPLVPAEHVLDRVLRDAPHGRGERLIGAVVATAAGVDDRVGIDAQAANWAVDGDRIACFDISTPMLRAADGRPRLELRPFLSIYPWALRPALRGVARSVMTQFHDPRTVLLDFASNLVKEELERWLPVALEAAADVVAPAITEDEVRRYFHRDRRLWLLMQRLRRLDRAWQRHVRHRAYPFLLPPPYRYGPPWQSKGEPA